MDLRTALMHELGHVLGLEHTAGDVDHALMGESLAAGELRLPEANVPTSEITAKTGSVPNAPKAMGAEAGTIPPERGAGPNSPTFVSGVGGQTQTPGTTISTDRGEQSRMNFITVVIPELGHDLGYADGGILTETLAAGVRLQPVGTGTPAGGPATLAADPVSDVNWGVELTAPGRVPGPRAAAVPALLPPEAQDVPNRAGPHGRESDEGGRVAVVAAPTPTEQEETSPVAVPLAEHEEGPPARGLFNWFGRFWNRGR
jgi:hypothetical protein